MVPADRSTSQQTRFDYVIASLSPEIACEVRDLLIRPPADGPLKAELIKPTAASEQRKLQQLIGGEELGDRKPTQLLRRMQQLLGHHLGPTTDIFLQRLPANIRMVLASADATTDLPKLADMADKIMEVATPSTVAATSTQPQVSDAQQLKEEITRITELVASLAQQRPRGRSRSRSRNTRQQSPARAD